MRLSRGEAADLSQYLEGEARQWLIDEALPDAADLSTEEFVDRIATRTGVSEAIAREAIHDVGNALSDVAPPEEIKRALDQLPAGFDSLLGFEE